MQKLDKNQIWHDVLSSVKVSVSTAIFSTWISKTHLVSLKKISKDRYLAEIGCLSSFVKATIETRYFGLIQESLIASLGHPCDLVFVVKQEDSAALPNQKPAPLFEEEEGNDRFVAKLSDSNIRMGQVFENFAVSGSNQMAWAASDAVSRNLGNAYNPLFIWGGVGVGKTHLMNAIGYRVLRNNIESKVLLCTGEQFTNDIVMGIRTKLTQNVRDKYRKLQALFVDDIQFIAGKDAVQEEFFHTFNAVTGAGGQVVLTSDRPPSEIQKLEERLKSRFEAGLIVDIAPPDFELRCAICQIKAKEKGLALDMNLVQFIAGNLETARKIEGFLVRLSSEARLRNVQPDLDLITRILGKGLDETKRHRMISPEEFITAVSTHYSLNKKALIGQARARTIARPRQVLMYLLRTELHLPYEEVGRIIGGRDHSTVIHAVTTISQLASNNSQIRDDILGIKSLL